MPDANGRSSSLAEKLANALPKDHGFKFYHLSTPPTRCAPLYSPPQGAKPERTYCESHFLTVSIEPEQSDNELLIFAMEVLIYSTRRLTTIFVSKADSTGYLPLLKLSKSHASPLRTVTNIFLQWLVTNRQRKSKKLVLSLFARAQDQYLFPGSVENAEKHVATDRGLISWWCRVVDPLLSPLSQPSRDEAGNKTNTQAFLTVPGEDNTSSFLPLHTRTDPILRKQWKSGHPLYSLSPYPQAPPRCLVPHFPDDPKSRFVNELDADLRDDLGASQHQDTERSPSKKGRGTWKSVRSLDQFWDMMAFRQECSSGRLVGFLWVVWEPDMDASHELGESQASTTSTFSNDFKPPPSPIHQDRSKKTEQPKRERPPLRGPIIPRLPRIKKSSSTTSSSALPETSAYYHWPSSARGTLVLSEKDYKRALDLLLKLDFANREIAAVGTRQWIDEVGVYAEGASWSVGVMGRKEGDGSTAAIDSNGVNVLGVKRKAQAVESTNGSGPMVESANGANVLGAGLVRKKVKLEAMDVPPRLEMPVVNTLGIGLVRKKPKA